MTNTYRKFLPHIDNNYDFAELLSEWLGELNVSHTGGRYSPKGKRDVTSNLGLLFDWNYQGKGMQIAEIIEKGPFDHSRTKVKAGCIIEKINGEEITLDNDITCLLNNKAGKKTLISIYNPQNKERWEEVVMPVTNGQLNGLLYKRWVKQRAADVEKWSKGRLGYVHIQSMGDDSFRTVYSDILGKYNNCEGIVIDTRFNGGGRLHEDIEILFSGQKYFTQVVRGVIVHDTVVRSRLDLVYRNVQFAGRNDERNKLVDAEYLPHRLDFLSTPQIRGVLNEVRIQQAI
jgi:tricorn protease